MRLPHSWECRFDPCSWDEELTLPSWSVSSFPETQHTTRLSVGELWISTQPFPLCDQLSVCLSVITYTLNYHNILIYYNASTVLFLQKRSNHSSHLTLSHLIPTDLISFNWVEVSALWSDPVRCGCDQSDKTAHRLHSDWSHTQLTGSLHTAHSLPLSSDETRNAWQSLAYSPLSAAVSPPSK